MNYLNWSVVGIHSPSALFTGKKVVTMHKNKIDSIFIVICYSNSLKDIYTDFHSNIQMSGHKTNYVLRYELIMGVIMINKLHL